MRVEGGIAREVEQAQWCAHRGRSGRRDGAVRLWRQRRRSGDGGDGGAEATGGTFSIYIGEPENPLVPGNTTETEGAPGRRLAVDRPGPVRRRRRRAEYTGVAESIESDDNTTWTVTLKDGWTFHDGTPVTAQSFVDAWNYTAYSPNAQGGSYFFGNIEGYGDLQAADATPTATRPATRPPTEMSGLEGRRRPDLHRRRWRRPFAQFPMTVGYSAFYRCPRRSSRTPRPLGTQPIGNGPFKADEEFVPGQGITADPVRGLRR